jgi:hypothetical protein
MFNITVVLRTVSLAADGSSCMRYLSARVHSSVGSYLFIKTQLNPQSIQYTECCISPTPYENSVI